MGTDMPQGYYVIVDGQLCEHFPRTPTGLHDARKSMYTVLRILPRKVVYIADIKPVEAIDADRHRTL